jgi:uncharacterized Zn-binding protein involved in type VI secretion
MKEAARMSDPYQCATHGTGAVADACEDMVLINGAPAARLASVAASPGGRDLIATGASMVLINGLPAARVGDTTDDAGQIVGPGAHGVLISGPTFSLPSVITIEGDETYRSKVLRDLYFISTTRTGRDVLARLERAGQQVIIKMPSETNREDAFDDAKSVAGIPIGSVIQYNPDYYGFSKGPNGEYISLSPQECLLHETLHSLADAEGRSPTGLDETVKGREQSRNVESKVIGMRRYEGEYPSENSFRDDLGLSSHRATHRVPEVNDPSQIPRPVNYRPGRP